MQEDELARWQEIGALAHGTDSQRRGHAVLTELRLLPALAVFDAVLIGTFPLDLDLPGSDLDIACSAEDLDACAVRVAQLYGDRSGYRARRAIHTGDPALVIEFETGGFTIQVFAQAIPVTRQRGYRHMLIEERLLRLAPAARSAIRALRAGGLKTEPAFARIFNLPGDPYETLYQMSDWDDERLAGCWKLEAGNSKLEAGNSATRVAAGGDRASLASSHQLPATSNQLPASSPAWWDARYRAGDARWDTGIVPPEVVALVASGVWTPGWAPGWALDLGCGPGVSSRYLTRYGFRVIGVDLSLVVLRRAHAAAAGLAAHFCAGDVTDLGFLRVRATLALDVGCFHSLPPDRRADYIASLAAHLLPGAHYLLYAFGPSLDADSGPIGLGPRDLAAFAPAFTLLQTQHGVDGDRPSAWYLFRRTNDGGRTTNDE